MNLRISILVMIFFGALVPSLFAAPKISASLSGQSAAVGESVDLEVTVEGSVRADAPVPPRVEGFDYQGMSQSNQMSIIGSNVSQRATYTMRYTARKEGTFTFPEIEVSVGGETVKTKPLTLLVKPGTPATSAGDVAFIVIDPLESTAYVGQDIGVNIKVYLDAQTRWNDLGLPLLTTEGFSPRPIKQGAQSEQEMGGKRYILATFRTVVTPTKAGKLSLGGAKVRAVYSRSRPGPYDPFLSIDRSQQMEISGPPVDIEVKPLPAAGRPKNFSGAIGSFEFSGSGKPGKVKVGEPVTMTLEISGQGNFNRITLPPLDDPKGWNAYDAEDSFKSDDDLGITGKKRFTLPVSPLEKKTTIPIFAFTYFDPKSEKYVTIKNEPLPLEVEGAPIVSVPAAASEQGTLPATEQKPDLLPNLPAEGANTSFRAPMTPSLLFGTILAPLPVIVALMIWRGRKVDPLAATLSALAHERVSAATELRQAKDRASLYAAFGRLLQIDTAIAAREPSISFDDAMVLSLRQLDGRSESLIREILAQRSELLFAGNAAAAPVSQVERDRVLDALHSWESGKPLRTPRPVATAIAVILLVIAMPGMAGEFESANKAFAEGKFEEARRGYERSLADGWKPGVLFNLGNTHFRLDRPGYAILNYERALALYYGHPDARTNAKFVREKTGGRIPEAKWHEAVLNAVNPRFIPWFGIALAWSGWAWAGASLIRRSSNVGVFGGVFLIAAGASLGGFYLWSSQQKLNDAIVLTQSDARREPADRSALAESLPPGSRIRVISEHGDWIYAALPTGQRGWLKAGTSERIIPANQR